MPWQEDSAAEFYQQEVAIGRRNSRETQVVQKVREANNLAKRLLILESMKACGTSHSVKVLDACCGRGGDMGKWGNTVSELMGIDISSSALREMTSRWNNCKWKYPKSVRVCKADLRDEISDTSSKYDVVSCLLGLNYMWSSKKGFKNCIHNLCNFMTEGGCLILAYVNRDAVIAWENSDNCTITHVDLKDPSKGYNFKLGDRVVDAVEYHVDRHFMDEELTLRGLQMKFRSSLVPYVSDQISWADDDIGKPLVEALAICNLYVVEMWTY